MNAKEAFKQSLESMPEHEFGAFSIYVKEMRSLQSLFVNDTDIVHTMLVAAIDFELARLATYDQSKTRIITQITYFNLLKLKMEQVKDLLVFT